MYVPSPLPSKKSCKICHPRSPPGLHVPSLYPCHVPTEFCSSGEYSGLLELVPEVLFFMSCYFWHMPAELVQIRVKVLSIQIFLIGIGELCCGGTNLNTRLVFLLFFNVMAN
jgi:hypothetical protein